MSAVQMGVAAVSMPASDESIHCSANEYIDSGNAIQQTPSNATRNRSARSTRMRRALGSDQSASAPKATRPNVMIPGSK